MTLEEYEKRVKDFDKSDGSWEYYILGLCGESGEIAELFKKHKRIGGWHVELDKEKLKLELGDLCWYLTRIATLYGMTLSEILDANVEKLDKRHAEVEQCSPAHHVCEKVIGHGGKMWSWQCEFVENMKAMSEGRPAKHVWQSVQQSNVKQTEQTPIQEFEEAAKKFGMLMFDDVAQKANEWVEKMAKSCPLCGKARHGAWPCD